MDDYGSLLVSWLIRLSAVMASSPKQLSKRLKMKRKDVQQLITRGQQLQAEEGLGETLHQDLQSLDNTISKMEQNMDSQEQSLEVSNVIRYWEVCWNDK